MTVEVSVSQPEDIGAHLATQRNVSATAAEALPARMDDAESRRAKRRADAEAYAEMERHHAVPGMAELDRATYEISSQGADW